MLEDSILVMKEFVARVLFFVGRGVEWFIVRMSGNNGGFCKLKMKTIVWCGIMMGVKCKKL